MMVPSPGHGIRSKAILVALVLATLAGPCAYAADKWAAIAFSLSTTQFGYAYGQSTQIAAERLAFRKAKARDARIVVNARNAWCALAQSKRGNGWGAGYSVNRAEAVAAAYRNCPDAGGKKLTVVVHANSR